jgi:hypothetical protein
MVNVWLGGMARCNIVGNTMYYSKRRLLLRALENSLPSCYSGFAFSTAIRLWTDNYSNLFQILKL